jgi:hypothetical protein
MIDCTVLSIFGLLLDYKYTFNILAVSNKGKQYKETVIFIMEPCGDTVNRQIIKSGLFLRLHLLVSIYNTNM